MPLTDTKAQLASDRAARAAKRKSEAQAQLAREEKTVKALKSGGARFKKFFSLDANPSCHLSQEILRALSKSAKLSKNPDLFSTQLNNFDRYCQAHRHLMNYYTALGTWKPDGKGAKTHLQSLFKHVLVTYPVPDFLYSVFREENNTLADKQITLFHRLASGSGLYKLAGTEEFPPPFTRRMCHDFLTHPNSNFTVANVVRSVQGRTFNGDQRLVNTLLRSRALGTDIFRPPEVEAFWQSVVQWFCVHAQFFNPHMVAPILDYLQYTLQQNEAYSMKGRTPNSVMRDMNDWHRSLGQGDIMEQEYTSSGFLPGRWEVMLQNTDLIDAVWVCFEILSGKALTAEGRAMRHCVASYAGAVSNGKVSIWSLRRNQERQLTIEVDNTDKQITQARGNCNRVPNNDERKYLKLWAQENGLTLGIYL